MSLDLRTSRPAELVRAATAYLAAHGVESAATSAEVLVMAASGTDRAGLFGSRVPLAEDRVRWLDRALRARADGVPLQHLTGDTSFHGLRLLVRPGVFVPRPETEVVALAALEMVAEREAPVVVDVGTGTGAIALAVKSARPDAAVWATDASREAVALARENAAALRLDVSVLEGELLDPLPASLRGAVDLLVSNPPYLDAADVAALPPEVRADPPEALVGGTDVHARLAALAGDWLARGGALVVEIGEDQGPEVAGLLRAAGLADVEVLPDLAGRARVVRGRLPAAGHRG
jgi:release factor glutamine methyltransferase